MSKRVYGRFISHMSLFAMTITVLAMGVSGASAAVFADSTCDENYYKSLEARAWLEAQREITQNQNLIYKPDSVLEYSCFNSHLKQVVKAADDLFSGDSGRWGDDEDMSGALSSIASAHKTYDESNFDHAHLGGRSSVADTVPDSSISGGDYACDMMKQVWDSARCMDFEDETNDGFFTFAQYANATDDKRSKPSQCSPYTATKTKFQNNIKLVSGTDAETPWEEDPVSTYYYLFERGGADQCGNNISAPDMPNKSKIKTGLVVERSGGGVNKYNEYICLVPGCYYKPTGLDAGKCELP